MKDGMGKVNKRNGIGTWAALALTALALAGCGGVENDYNYGGVAFTGKAKPVKGDRTSFVSTAGPASASLDGAIGGANYEGIKYCIDYLGTSDIEWQVGPDTPRQQLDLSDNRVTFRGRCVE